MSQFNHDSQPEGDGDERGNLSWSEADWHHFLHRREKEIARFLEFYDQAPVPAMDRLDWAARQMGWESGDWSVSDFPDDEADEADEAWREPVAADDEDMDPYTLHRHPVYIVSSGLFLYLRFTWQHLLTEQGSIGDARLNWDFAESLNEAEKHCLMALQSMDMGDFLLCVIHLKRALRGLNLAMSLLPQLFSEMPERRAFEAAFSSRLFDLREVFLRVMQDCREEEHKDFRD
jgi:hypothetical protein